jgi:phospholipid-transporting ATPase
MYGLAVYAGMDTKIMLNSRQPPSKLSTLEKYVNVAIIIIFIAQCILVTVSVGSTYIISPSLPYGKRE